ncbi:MAG: MFS transporter [Dysgonamonadaceae bacterium]|nr:MFS transporter [Dysgonamonadaceae bacterium]
MNQSTKPRKSITPWSWIPTLYFGQGIPYVVVMTVAVIMYKRFGLSNTDIALYTSWLYLPWVIKPFWSPFVDILKTKRWWIVTMQLLIGAGLAGVAFTLPTPFYFQATLGFFWLLAFSSATHDIAADGFYMIALDDSQQSFFVGIRSTFYRLAMIVGQGLLIILAGTLEIMSGSEPVFLNVSSSPTAQSEIRMDELPQITSSQDESTFVIYPENLVLNTNKIPVDSLNVLKGIAENNNLSNGFVKKTDEQKNIESGNTQKSWWSQNVAAPLGNYIKTNFGEKRKVEGLNDDLVGNASLVAIRLSKAPKEGDEIVLNTTLSDGDQSISLISGERLVFSSKNWDKPAYALVQLDPNLNKEVSATFRGISGNIPLAWSITFFILAGLFVTLFIYHNFILPRPKSDKGKEAHSVSDISKEFGRTFASFFSKKGIGLAIAFMLLYRLAEAMLVKLASPFLLDIREIGGMGLSTQEVGLVYGTVGVISLTLGGIIGGVVASQKGLKYWLWPMALSITLPNAAYLLLSYFQPESFFWINAAVAVEQFGYGFGFTAYMLYLIYFSDGEHKTAHYSICTGFMALGMMIPGMVSGWLQDLVGYNHFFILIMIATIPTLLIIPFLKIDPEFGKRTKKEKIKQE